MTDLHYTPVEFDPFAHGEVEATVPITEAQREIWLSDQMGKDASCAFIESMTLMLKGKLDVAALRQAIQSSVERHEALRMTFSQDGDTLSIMKAHLLDVPLVDLSELGEEERNQKYEEILRDEMETQFDLLRGPLFRARIIKISAEEHRLILSAHHIVCDGWSWSVFVPDMGAFYTAYSHGSDVEMGEPLRFRDYAWQMAKQEETAEMKAAQDYWAKQFSGTAPQLDLPTDHPRPSLRSFNARRLDWELEAELVASLQRVASKFGCSLVNIILAAYEVLFFRITGQDDFVLGIPSAGQAATSMFQLVGHCVNLLPLRTHIEPERPFKEHLLMRRKALLDAYDHQQLSYGKLIETLRIPRDPSRVPLVPITINVEQSIVEADLKFAGLEVSPKITADFYHNFEMSINLTQFDGQTIVEIQFNTDLFETETIRRWMRIYESILRGVIAAPETPLVRLPLMSEEEKHKIVVEWNNTRRDYAREESVQRLFEEQAERKGEEIAVTHGEKQVTYRELNLWANQVAQFLMRSGIGNGQIVGICMERSWQMVATMLGVLKAGAAYMPIDVQYPKKRIIFMLTDAHVPVLITMKKHADTLPGDGARVVFFDEEWKEAYPTAATLGEEAQAVRGGAAAYVMYTSGSSGEPKGVVVPHRAINRLVCNTNYITFQATDVIAHASNPAFDASTLEVWGALLNGLRVVVVDTDTLLDARKFGEYLQREKVSILWLTAGLFNQYVAENPEIFKSLRVAMFGGEAATPKWVRRLCEVNKPPELLNGYGPTENTTFTTICRVESVAENAKSVPIGRPIANTTVYLLDAYMQPVPVGMVGELYTGGDGLANGYLHRPELTESVFVQNPFDPQGRLYKTGDLARYLPDGNIDFIGRKDQQVKLRGFRIEIEEIEAILTRHANIEEVAVVMREFGDGDKRLVAYYVPKQGKVLGVNELREYLGGMLPEYMVPSIFVPLEKLPLNPNGKVDQRALPVPKPEQLTSTDEEAALTPLEQVIAGIWSEILDIDHVGAHENFFELGGHSLLAARIIAKINELFSTKLSIRQIISGGTVAVLASEMCKDEKRREEINELAELLLQVSGLSDEQVEKMLQGPK